ncbi:MAG: CBS domain-containing protein [Woeseiaceae bacterium]
MRVREIMTDNPACCTAESNVREVARMMAENDCGEIPVLDQSSQPIGVVTDRDIACRVVGMGKDPDRTIARDVMSSPVITASPEDDVAECCEKMEQEQIRRVPVVDRNGACCGMIAQADIARAASERDVAELLRDVSQPGHQPPHAS